MPACARLEPTYPDWWLAVDGRADMIKRNEWISPERKARLLELVPEWDEWAKKQVKKEARIFSEFMAERRSRG
jgi:hypothetical protein